LRGGFWSYGGERVQEIAAFVAAAEVQQNGLAFRSWKGVFRESGELIEVGMFGGGIGLAHRRSFLSVGVVGCESPP
jgi:hypothetical protein